MEVAIYHSVLGVRPGLIDVAARFNAAGHRVELVDQYDGRTFDSYDEASAFVEGIGFPALLASALDGVAHLDDGFVAAGFSNGAGMAEYVATQRSVSGVVLLSGAIPLNVLGVESWPAGVPAQIHATTRDPFRNQEWVDVLVSSIQETSKVEVFDYDGDGHLFTDPSLPMEYEPENAEKLWGRVIEFCNRHG